MAELRDLINQIRKKVEFLPDGQERSEYVDFINTDSPVDMKVPASLPPFSHYHLLPSKTF